MLRAGWLMSAEISRNTRAGVLSACTLPRKPCITNCLAEAIGHGIRDLIHELWRGRNTAPLTEMVAVPLLRIANVETHFPTCTWC